MKILIVKNKKEHDTLVETYKSKGFLLAEIHSHTSRTDGITSLNKMIKTAAKKNLYIAITDHNYVHDFNKLNKKQKQILIPGIEITGREGIDIIAYFYNFESALTFYNKVIKPRKQSIYRTDLFAQEILIELSKMKCVINIAHINYPIDPIRTNFVKSYANLPEKAIGSIDCLEIFNSSHHKKIPAGNKELAISLNKNFIAGTDAHSRFSIGNSVVCTKAKTKDQFLDNLVKGDYVVVCRKTPLLITMLPLLKVFIVSIKSFLRIKND